MQTISNEEAIELIKKIIEKEGAQYKAAKKLGISAAYLSDILKNRRAISDKVSKKLGYERITTYKKLSLQ